MNNIIPHPNVTAAYVAGAAALMFIHVLQANGVIIPEDVAQGLPGLFAVVVAHIWDSVMSKKPDPAKQ